MNAYSISDEFQSVSDNLSEILIGVISALTLVDLGCGDGRKGSQFISQANQEGYLINRCIAVDINNDLIETAISRVVNNVST